MNRVSRQLLQEKGREPTAHEIGKMMGIREDKVRWVMRTSRQAISLETPVGEEDSATIADLIEDEGALSPWEETSTTKLKEATQEVLARLTAREAKVLRMRFGIEMSTDHTLEDVGKQFDVTRERIRQIEAKTLKKLRSPERSKGLRTFVEDY